MAQAARTRARRVASIALGILGGVVALISLVVGGTLVVLRTDWGGERIRRQVVSRVNRQIQGTLAIERLSFGGHKVQVWGVALRDPAGGMVAHVARAEVDFAPLRVLRKELRVTAVAIETPIVSLVSDEDGSNLARATAPRKEAPTKAAEPKKVTDRNGPEGWVVRLDRFDLTHGDVTTAVAASDDESAPTPRAHLANLGVFASARYATGNGSMDLTVRVSGQSERVPVGPLRLAAQVAAHGDVYRVDADGDLLGGTLDAHGNVDTRRLESADGRLALAIPRQELAGYTWGPLRIDARAEPSKAPKLKARLEVPGIEFAAQDSGRDTPGVQGRLTVSDLAITGKAVRALSGSDVPPLGGHGEVTFGIEKAKGAGPAGFEGLTKGSFESLRFGETVISRLTLDGQAARLSSRPGTAKVDVGVASVSSGTTDIRGIAFAAKLNQQDVSATLEVAAPARVDLSLAGRLSEDRHIFDLTSLSVAFPGGRWVSEGVARLRSDAQELSLSKFRLTSEGQALAIDGARRGEDISGHLALTGLRLERLPTALIAPRMRLTGVLDVDVKAEGQTRAPRVVAQVDLKQAEYQGFSKIDARLAAKLENERVDATVDVDAPFLAAHAAVELPTDPLEPGAPIDVKLDVKRLDVGQLLRAAERPALADGRLNLKLRADGSADKPNVTLTLEAFDLQLKPPAAKEGAAPLPGRAQAKAQAAKAEAGESVDLGKARVRLTYADRAARAEVDFTSAHGGTLAVDARTRVDLSYPRVKRPIVAAKLPIHGKVVARDLDVAWVAQLNPRVESMGGQVTADARLGGTVGDPQVIGEVRWKNGAVVATTPPPAAGKPPANSRPQARRVSSAR